VLGRMEVLLMRRIAVFRMRIGLLSARLRARCGLYWLHMCYCDRLSCEYDTNGCILSFFLCLVGMR
jgi:hypothetical protein